jgi:hypothetical protein
VACLPPTCRLLQRCCGCLQGSVKATSADNQVRLSTRGIRQRLRWILHLLLLHRPVKNYSQACGKLCIDTGPWCESAIFYGILCNAYRFTAFDKTNYCVASATHVYVERQLCGRPACDFAICGQKILQGKSVLVFSSKTAQQCTRTELMCLIVDKAVLSQQKLEGLWKASPFGIKSVRWSFVCSHGAGSYFNQLFSQSFSVYTRLFVHVRAVDEVVNSVYQNSSCETSSNQDVQKCSCGFHQSLLALCACLCVLLALEVLLHDRLLQTPNRKQQHSAHGLR